MLCYINCKYFYSILATSLASVVLGKKTAPPLSKNSSTSEAEVGFSLKKLRRASLFIFLFCREKVRRVDLFKTAILEDA